MAAGYDGSIRINTKINSQGFNTGIQSMTASLGKMAVAVGLAFSVTALVKMGKQAVELASSLAEVDNVVSKSFGNMRAEMDSLADTAIESLGMSRLTAYQTGANFMAMGKSMVDSANDAKDMALGLTKLTGNMSSFYNVRQDIASTALKSIYTGETETLKQFGVVMTETNLKQFALERGIHKQIAAMTQSEKVILRYQYVTEQLSFIGNDFLDTQDSWANQTRILSEQWKELLSILGSGLITVLTPVVKGLNGIVSALISVANTVGQVMAKVFGIKAQQLEAKGIEDEYADIAGSAGDAAGATDEYGNAIEKAGKKAQGALASFDNLNVLQQKGGAGNSNQSGSSGSKIESTDIIPTETFNGFDKQMGKIADRVKELKSLFAEGFDNGFKTDKLEEVQENIGRIRDGLITIFSDPQVQKSVNDFVDQTALMLGTLTGAGISIGISVADGITGGMAQAFEKKEFQEFASTKISSIFDNLTETEKYVTDFAEACSEVATAFESDAFKDIVQFFVELSAFVDLTVIDAVTGFFSDIVGFFTSPITENAEEWERLLENIFKLVNNLLGPAKDLLTYLESKGGKYQDSAFHKFMEDMKGNAVENVRKSLEGANSVLEKLIDATDGFDWEQFWTSPFLFLEDEFTEFDERIRENVETTFTDIADNITSKLNKIRDWFTEKKDLFASWIEEDVTPWFTEEKWNEILRNIGKSLVTAIAGFRDAWAKDIPEWFENDVKPWFTAEKWLETAQGIEDGISAKWDEIKIWWNETISVWWEESVAPWFSLDTWAELAQGIEDGIEEKWNDVQAWWDESIGAWWENSVAPWFSMETWLKLGENMKNGIYNGFKNVVLSIINLLNNGIIAGFENMANRVVEAINEIIAGWNALAPEMDMFQITPFSPIQLGRIPTPKLAQGAVIPPNSQFLAILGDQTSGKNIEAPSALIKQMVMEGLSEAGGNTGRGVPVNLNLYLNGEKFAYLTVPNILEELKRGGYDLEPIGG